MNLNPYKQRFEEYLLNQIPEREPKSLYEPLRYVLSNGGKRIRPLLVLLAGESYGVALEKALPAAAAIETFHNFTLIHDDIMDKADIRRGQATVHKKWNESLAILSGDTMLIWAYKMLEKYDAETYKTLSAFLNQTAIEVCEGQQMDMDFENRNDVSIEKYLEMIRLKTAILLGTALKFGAVVAGISGNELENLYNFGTNLGIAFQIQDDYLDSFGTVENFGKKIGGDIIDRKKTFLFIKALELANKKDKDELLSLFNNKSIENEDLINRVLSIFNKYNISELTKEAIEKYTQESLINLEQTAMPEKFKTYWKKFASELMHREK